MYYEMMMIHQLKMLPVVVMLYTTSIRYIIHSFQSDRYNTQISLLYAPIALLNRSIAIQIYDFE